MCGILLSNIASASGEETEMQNMLIMGKALDGMFLNSMAILYNFRRGKLKLCSRISQKHSFIWKLHAHSRER